MVKPRRNERKAEVKDIASKAALQRYGEFLENEFKAEDVPDKGEYVSLHKRIRLQDGKSINIIVYSTNGIYVSGSPSIDGMEFAAIATRVVELAQQATTHLEQIRPISIQRAKCILDFARKLNLDNEYERMVTIILSDTCNEIILREQMKALKIEGGPLEEGIPEKIKRLKDKGYPIVAEEPMKNLRETRNRIVHHGDVPHKEQAAEALKIADQVLSSVLAK